MKAIYVPKGKAREYADYACNLYNGCSNKCTYCYNNCSRNSGVVGGENVRLKKTLIDESTAYETFKKELDAFKSEIIAGSNGLHFNFVSDPCLKETIVLNWKCIDYAISQGVPCQVLTKRADWLDHPAVQNALAHPDLLRVGFSLTGCDELEPGASSNAERIQTMRMLHDAGVSTWASIEPIIDPQASLKMILQARDCCDHYKIGVLSGIKNYTPQQIRDLKAQVDTLGLGTSIYWKKDTLDFMQKK